MECELYVPEPFAQLLLIQAAEQEASVEEILERAIRKYMERNGEHAV